MSVNCVIHVIPYHFMIFVMSDYKYNLMILSFVFSTYMVKHFGFVVHFSSRFVALPDLREIEIRRRQKVFSQMRQRHCKKGIAYSELRIT